MKVSFITPAYNAGSTLRGSIESFINQKTIHELEFIIVDDGSTDDTLRIADDFRKYLNIRIISKENGGEASALNEGLDHATGDYVVLAEADVEFDENWLEEVLAEFKDPDVMGVGGRLITHPNDNWIARIHGYEIEYKFEGKERNTRHITSANAIYRREIFDKCGRFNEQLINASLDADLNQRIIDEGYKLIYVNTALAYHHYKPSLFGYMKRQYSYARYRPYLKGKLYERESGIVLQSILAGLFMFSILLFLVSMVLFSSFAAIILCSSLIFFLVLLLTQIPITARVVELKKDKTFIIFPIISVIRACIWVVAYGIGLLRR